MTEKWNKYSYLNTENNCLIEVTHLEGTEEKLILIQEDCWNIRCS